MAVKVLCALLWTGRAARFKVNKALGEVETANNLNSVVDSGVSTENYCADFQYTRRYAKCSAFSKSTRYSEAYCNAPIMQEEIASSLQHDKCIKCSKTEIEAICSKVEKPCSTEAMEEVEGIDTICKGLVFGYSENGREVNLKYFGKYMREQQVSCSVNMAKDYCEKTWYPKAKSCAELSAEEVDLVCTKILPQKGSAKHASLLAGAVFGAKCTPLEVREMCNKQTCESFTEGEFEQFCESKIESGLSAAEASEFAQEIEFLTCSKETISAKCPKACDVDEETEKDICDAMKFGYTRGGSAYTADVSYSLKKMGIRCTSEQIKLNCKERESPACETIPDEKKERACELLEQKGAQALVGPLGGIFGVECTTESLREMCSKSTCESLSGDDWETLCDIKDEKRLLRSEFAAHLKDYEGLQCSEAEIKAHCPSTCEIEESKTKEVCPMILSGYSKKGPIEWDDRVLRRLGVGCKLAAAKEACNDAFEFKKCTDLESTEKEQICALLKRGTQSLESLSGLIGGALSTYCSTEDLSNMCA